MLAGSVPGVSSPLSTRRRREVAFVALFALLSLGAWAFRTYEGSSSPARWAELAETRSQEHLHAAAHAFTDLQRTSRELADEVGAVPAVIMYLNGETTDRRPLFDAVRRIAASSGTGVEVYDSQGELAGWSGQSGDEGRREIGLALAGRTCSFVSRNAVSSQLFVAVPVRHDARIIGVIVIRQTIEVASPLRNRFLGREGLAERVSDAIGVPVEFVFPPDTISAPDTLWRAMALVGIDSVRVGDVRVAATSGPGLGDQWYALFTDLIYALAAIALVGMAVLLVRWLMERASPVPRTVGIMAVLWSVRFTLLSLDIPGRLLGTALFDPIVYASMFGGGLARSPGDMLFTVVTLLLTFVLGIPSVSRAYYRDAVARRPFVVRLFASVLSAALIFLLVRGFAAAVRSMMYDSTLTIGDPALLLPPPVMGVLLLNGILLAAMLSGVAIEIVHALVRWVRWTGTALLGAAGIALYALQDEPLMSVPMLAGWLLVVVIVLRMSNEGGGRWWSLAGPSRFLAFLVCSVMLLLPVLDLHVRERDRSKIETFAAEVIRPVDGWLKFIVEDGLQHLTSVVGTSASSADDPALALRAWAQSAACREGYSSIFEVLDPDGNTVSRFAIGGQTGVAEQVGGSVPLDTVGVLRVKSIGDGVSAVRVYAGSVPVGAGSERFPVHVRVTVAAGEEQLFRGANPAVLRGLSRETLESFYRPITITEYRDGLFLRSTNKAFPFTHVLPQDLRETLPVLTPPMTWRSEAIGGTHYETFYAVRGDEGRSVVGLSMEEQPLIMRLVGLVKVVFVYVLLLACWGGVLMFRKLLAGQAVQLTFRDRLLGMMFLVTLLPLGVLLVYSQLDVRDRMIENTALRLEDQTSGIAQDIAGIGEHADASSELEIRPDRVELIASNTGTDFNMYVGNELRISSRPELYTSGLLDPRISGSAYAEVVLGGKWFWVETEHIGQFRYVVGYRPVIDAAGGVIGVVSVPTVFRQDEMDRGLVARHAVLFGVYAVVLLAMLIITPVLAHRFASPVLRLTSLAREVGKGDLDISGRLPRADGEIGELVHAFDSMTREIARSRDSLVKVERELAWKEMARQVAHEIRNPLTPMKLSIQHLRRTYLDGAPDFPEIMERVTRTTISQIDALGRIAAEFASFARMPRRIVAACDPGEIVREAVALFRQDTAVQFEVQVDAPLPPIQADREELRRACINIIRNGVQAMGGTGTMEVRVSAAPGLVQVSFTDHGQGIPDDVKPKLFQPKFSTKTDGMGLGLAIVKKTIDDLGGTITIESAIGKGTTVVMEIPAGEVPV
ncbi:MAG: HAMP domain-containing protein [Ignavibacteriae bacterium]|nr:HAMP domain-containing protein [Ignavibacteriota bacterium]